MIISDRNKISGFSLVEATFVIIIVGFIISTIIFTTQARLDASRIYTTKERMQIITDAIERYVENYGHVPCPASPVVTRSDPNYGWGTGTNSAETAATASCPQAITLHTISADNDIKLGAVPFRTLVPPLDPQVSVDGWGNRFTYIVTERYTVTAGFADTSDSDADYHICNHEGCTTGGTNLVEADQVAYILISHGENGYNAYVDKTGNRISSGNASLEDIENGDSDNIFVLMMPRNKLESSVEKSTDDILIFKEKWQLPNYINE